MPEHKATSKTPVNSISHSDTRANIPTEELRGFVSEEEQKPKKILYPRDPSLDPQLVWKGKDEQDAADLEVPSVPIYIQEKIHPQAIIEDFRRHADKAGPGPGQLDLFADAFNGLPFEEQVEFYQHANHWSSRMILGDSLMVMNSLAEKEGLKGQVQMIYLDPPYGIKFGSNWQVSTRKRDVKDGKAEDLTRQPEQVRAFRDTWEHGIHSYLAYLRDRLVVARELLTESGSIFVQIGDENVHLVRCLLDEVFGSENFVSEIAFKKRTSATADYLGQVNDFIIWYAKAYKQTKYRPLFFMKSSESQTEHDLGGDVVADSLMTAARGGNAAPFSFRGRDWDPGARNNWKTSPTGLDRLALADRIVQSGKTLRYTRVVRDFPAIPVTASWSDTTTFTQRDYVVQTNLKVVQRCLLMSTDPGDLVLDPTCGSGTTAYVAEQWGRRWITIDTSRVALALARTRLMSAKFPYYFLADSLEGARKEAELDGVQISVAGRLGGDIKKGFVYQRVPHITLKSIANNEEIDTIHERWQEKLEPLRERINSALGKNWEEWEIPRTDALPPDTGEGNRQLIEQWWALRRERQKEIDDSIARRADTETLFDKPYEDKKRLRVSGPFTVESLSPHRTISVEKKLSDAEGTEHGFKVRVGGAGQFGITVIENLKKAGVQNTTRNERLKFDRLEVYPGEWIQAAGEYAENGKTRRVALTIGPEFGTVGSELVKEAAKEAVKGEGFDTLIIAGLAFDPHVSEEAKQYGNLTILPTRINADLTMGDSLLKKTGAGNLFMIFGEPDIQITRSSDEKVQVEIRGLDIFDPTTGEIRANSTDDIACWFIDTDYNEESFFVRHAYFTGADEPYDKLKRALRAEVDEAAWSALYSTVSRPFDAPSTGKIAVKVINHYGDEVLKVYEV